MKRVLGLDLGSSSIGWAVVDQAVGKEEKSAIIRLGVRCNPLTTDEKSNFKKGRSITTTADRTLKRGMRRNLQRYKQRREHLIALLKKAEFISENTILSENGNATTFQTYRLRAKAVVEKITLEELARVLLMINKKRGYKSNRKADNQDEGKLIDGMAIARTLYTNRLTPGEYTYGLLMSGKNFIPAFYRSDLEAELNAIWVFQRQFYPDILTNEMKERIFGKGKNDTEKAFYLLHHVSAAEEKDRKIRLKVYYRWRSEALKQRLEIEQIVQVVASINAAIAASSGYLGQISDRSKVLFFNRMTVGQYLLSEIEKNPHFRIKDNVFYRQDYLDEFEQIWENQRKYHPELTPELKENVRDAVIFYQRRLKSKKGLIAFCEFEQKEIAVPMNGHIKHVKTGARVCPKSSPLYQEFKIWQVLNLLKISSKNDNALLGGQAASLTAEQKQVLYKELLVNKEMSKSDILKRLGLKANGYAINYEKVQGNTTTAMLVNACKEIVAWSGHEVDLFDKLKADEKLQYIQSVFGLLGARTDLLDFDDNDFENSTLFHLWHLLYSYEGDNSETGSAGLLDKIAGLTGLPREYAEAFAQVSFKPDYGSLSSKAIKKILPYLKEGYLYSDACELAGYTHSKESLTKEKIENKVLVEKLDLLPKNSLRNPVVEKILNQMIHVVNACSEHYGPFDEIHIELARELKQSQQQREDATRRLNVQTRETEKIVEILQSTFGINRPSRNDIIRYRLYQELAPNGYKTLYSQTYIPQEKLFSREFDIEHIIPQAKLFDDSFSNKTLELRSVNLEKSNMTAFDFVKRKWGDSEAAAYRSRVTALFGKGNEKKKKHLLMTEEEIPSDFLNRDLSDSQYIAREARKMLMRISKVVIPTVGSITARLREDWQLVDVMKELNWNKYDKLGLTETYRNREGHEIRRIKDWTKRNDQRHHAMDALTIAFTRLQHIQLLNNLNAGNNDKMANSVSGILKNELIEGGRFKSPIPLEEFREEVKRHIEMILISIKAKNKVATRNTNKIKGASIKQIALTPRGQMHNETVYGERLRYATKEEKIGSAFDESKILTVCRRDYREALLKRLQQFGDARNAFTGKNALEKNPLFIYAAQTIKVPSKVKTVTMETFYTVRKPVDSNLNLEKVVDSRIRQILQDRLTAYGGDAGKAFSNIDENPIWLNKDKGIAIKRVAVKGVNVAIALHDKKDKEGRIVEDEYGKRRPSDFVSTGNNHHVAIFEDEDGNLQEHIVSFFEAMTCLNNHLPVIDREYNESLGWKFLFTMKQNEFFVVPDEKNDFNPEELDLTDEQNYPLISPHLYRVQKFSTKDYVFRHHLETQVIDQASLHNTTWIRIKSINNLKGFVKVRVNHLGKIVQVGEY